ncbi:MAG: 2-amino-4-hydroxy-6-hydroxymethyldihydropteridine diphosphokinase, partial [Pseudomonadota bacterium]
GSNAESAFGSPAETLAAAVAELRSVCCPDLVASSVYTTAPVGHVRQPDFLNIAAAGDASLSGLSPRQILLWIGRYERAAGRRPGQRWGPRPLDIDLIAYGDAIVGWPPNPRFWRHITLPHPQAHRRAFVLEPLRTIRPDWQHPVFRKTVDQLLRELPAFERVSIARAVAQ